LVLLAVAVVLPVAIVPSQAAALSNGLSQQACGIDGVAYPQGTVMIVRGRSQICKDGGWVPGGSGAP
jgi:hypothetical protein